jgi:hypothetical protein
LQPHLIKFTSCLPMVGGSLRVLRLPRENQREYCNDCYIFMADVLFQFCYDIICIDVSKTLIPSCFYFQVFEHKEAKSGKSCYVRVTSGLLADLVAYRDRVRKPLSGNLWLFLTRTGKFISPSVSKIIALIQSRTYGIISN